MCVFLINRQNQLVIRWFDSSPLAALHITKILVIYMYKDFIRQLDHIHNKPKRFEFTMKKQNSLYCLKPNGKGKIWIGNVPFESSSRWYDNSQWKSMVTSFMSILWENFRHNELNSETTEKRHNLIGLMKSRAYSLNSRKEQFVMKFFISNISKDKLKLFL